MKISGLFKLPRHKQFDIKPRYWDKDKEEREKRMEKIRQKYDHTVDVTPGSSIRGSFKENYITHKRSVDKYSRIRSIIIIITIGFLILLIYMLSHYIPYILK